MSVRTADSDFWERTEPKAMEDVAKLETRCVLTGRREVSMSTMFSSEEHAICGRRARREACGSAIRMVRAALCGCLLMACTSAGVVAGDQPPGPGLTETVGQPPVPAPVEGSGDVEGGGSGVGGEVAEPTPAAATCRKEVFITVGTSKVWSIVGQDTFFFESGMTIDAAGGVAYVVFPGSGNGRPRSLEEINAEGERLFRAWGGERQLDACLPNAG
jgi:hypothetical protein